MSNIKWVRNHYCTGQLYCEIPFVNGQLHGVARGYNEDGTLRYEVPYVNGQSREDLLKEENRLLRLVLLGHMTS